MGWSGEGSRQGVQGGSVEWAGSGCFWSVTGAPLFVLSGVQLKERSSFSFKRKTGKPLP